MHRLNKMAALADKERGAVFNNFQTELSNGNECSSFPITGALMWMPLGICMTNKF